MKRDWDDEAMRRLFAELRAADEDGAPAFDATLATAREAGRRRATPALGRQIGAVAAALLVTVGGVWLASHPHRATRASAALPASLSEWRSPTAFLLDGPGDLLVKTLPSIPASTPELHALGVTGAHGGHS